jgi:SAM-dependent methyltransferase
LSSSRPKLELFAVSAVFLFLELAFIRWFPAHVLFLTFFTNTVLLASFLGLSLGCLAARGKRNFLPLVPLLLAIALAAGIGMEWARLALQNLIDVGGNKAAPQMVYFGAEAGARDVSSFVIPIEWIAGAFFALIAATMAGLGQFLGRRFAAIPNAVEAYMINIGGSLAGIVLFQCFSWWLSPVWWFGLVAAGVVWFLWQEHSECVVRIKQEPRNPALTGGQAHSECVVRVDQQARPRWWAMGFAAAAPLLALASSHSSLGVIRKQFPVESWSPYYRINYAPDIRAIAVNLLGHQNMVSRRDPFPAYAIPYLLNRDSSQPPFHNVLIIGAGSGNDVSRALEWAAPDAHIDAVEIDPVIKNLGIANHPDHPYQDPRVTLHLNDGRNFLRSANGKYDLIVFALIDSLVLHSSLSNLRLESYLFTEEALADVRRALAPDGLFVMYNYFRQGWIVSRLAKTAETAFGLPPLVLTLPERGSIAANEKVEGFTLLFDGPRSAALRRAFDPGGAYRIGEIRLSPAKVEIPPDLRNATDAWPFLYLHEPMIPSLVWRGMAVMGVISLVMLWRAGFSARGALVPQTGSATMLLLGAGFMLLETKAVVHMALIFGSTWIVNSVVFAAILVMILAANLRVMRRKSISLLRYYVGLLAALALNLAIPLDSFLGWPFAVRAVLSGALVLGPVFFAGVVFAGLIRQSDKPEQALAWNTTGAILGGFAENASLWIGFQYLTAVAGLIYLASWWASRHTQSYQGTTQ